MTDPKKTCPYCEGSGVVYTDDDRDTCPNCQGDGYVYPDEDPGMDDDDQPDQP